MTAIKWRVAFEAFRNINQNVPAYVPEMAKPAPVTVEFSLDGEVSFFRLASGKNYHLIVFHFS